MIRNQRKKNFKETGITLVALVVTIIVLLILAGVTIRLALGSNGIIEKAQIASNMYANATKDERTSMEEMTNEVAKLSQGIGEQESADDVLSLGAAINSDSYGKLVTNYIANGMKWRLFYEDSNNVYLISETQDGGYPQTGVDLCGGTYQNYTSKGSYATGRDVSEEGQALLPLLGGATESLVGTNPSGENYFTESNTIASIWAVAYLCDTSSDGPWISYKEEEAEWAMGAPTLELFAASYNATHDEQHQITLSIDEGLFGYQYNLIRVESSRDDRQGIYYPLGDADFNDWWWIAGPRRYIGSWDGISVYCIGSSGFDWRSVDEQFNVRPVVCLKKSNFQYILES